jgi:hypothetical protein
MSGYLDDYGVSDSRREKIFKRIVVSTVILAIVASILYFQFRNYREEQQIQSFIALLEQKDYKAAYELWGCTEESPCPGYAYEKFLEDWGPESIHPDITAGKITRTRSCSGGIIQTLTFGEDDEVLLWVERADLVIGFSPWPMCDPQLPASALEGQ